MAEPLPGLVKPPPLPRKRAPRAKAPDDAKAMIAVATALEPFRTTPATLKRIVRAALVLVDGEKDFFAKE